MAERRDWPATIDTYLSLFDRFGVLVVSGGVIGAVATYLTDFFAVWAPASYVAGAVVGALSFSLWGAIRDWRKTRKLTNQRIEQLEPPKGYVSLARKRFENERIYITDLLLPTAAAVYGKEFDGCEIIGPANIFLDAQNAGQNQFHSTALLNCDILFFEDGAKPTNVTIFRDCIIRNSTIVQCSLLFHEDVREAVKEKLGKTQNYLN